MTVSHGDVMVGKANATATDIVTSNGVIHVIDEVILPAKERAASGGAAAELIRLAIDRGVPLYNHGPAAAQGLISSPEMSLSAHDRRTLESAMETMHSTRDASRQAWIMRDVLDDVM